MVGPSMKWKAFCCFGSILRDDTGIRMNLCAHSCLLSERVRASWPQGAYMKYEYVHIIPVSCHE